MSRPASTRALVTPESLVRRTKPRRGEHSLANQVDLAALERALQARVRGGVHFDPSARALYAHDASNYRRVPLGVVTPDSAADVESAISVCRDHGAPIVARGGGTGLAGQTVNEAVVFDFSKHMTRVLAIDPIARRARVEPGVVCDALVHAAKPFDLTFGPKPATHDHCCFGGMLANNCGGRHAQMNGIAVHNVESLDVVLYDGTRLRLGATDDREIDQRITELLQQQQQDAQHDSSCRREADLLLRFRSLRRRYETRIRAGYPRLPRRVSGYNLDALLPDEHGRYNLAQLIVGSEGTLATILEAEVKLIADPKERAVVALAFDDIFAAADSIPDLLFLASRRAPPPLLTNTLLAVEGIDKRLCDQIRTKGGLHAEHLELLPKPKDSSSLSSGLSYLLVEVGADTRAELERRVSTLVTDLNETGRVRAAQSFFDEEKQKAIWDAREGALGATAFVPGEPDTWPGWEDSAVPPERLGAYLRELRALCDRYDYSPSLYGHFGHGLVHCRIDFRLFNRRGIDEYLRFVDEAADLVVSYGGSLSGEHGDGQARAMLLEKMFGADLMEAMRELKATFDPDGRMNPGKIVDPYPIDDHLKQWPPSPNFSPDYPHATHFRFPDDGGSFLRASMRCVGVGKCRRQDSGAEANGQHDVMCPSYMVTREEKHSTRGRAHLLWEMLRQGSEREDGRPIQNGYRDDSVKEALDLCLACKGCKSDCPVNVDMATYKAEFLSHYWQDGAPWRLRPRHAYAFGYIDVLARLADLAPSIVNFVTQTPGLSALAKVIAGIAQDMELPVFARRSFRKSWLKAHRDPRCRRRRHPPTRRVLLWPDTFNNHFHPDTAHAAARVLEKLGYEVRVPHERVCCGRPLYDFGMLDRAKRYLERCVAVTKPYLDEDKDMKVVFLEPSCASVFKDELVSLLPAGDPDARRLRDRTVLLSELLESDEPEQMSLIAAGAPGQKKKNVQRRRTRKAIVQGHCHQKTTTEYGMRSEQQVLERLGVDAEVLSAGCCGMAGAFGFVAETSAVGRACGERRLVPAVQSAPETTLIVADGFSCREQIRQRTDRTALHLAEVLDLALDDATGNEDDDVSADGRREHHDHRTRRPEGNIAARRARERRSMTVRGGVGSIAVTFAVLSIAITIVASASAIRKRRRRAKRRRWLLLFG